MSDHPHASAHDDPMSHVPPGSIWPLVVAIGLTLVPFGTVSVLGALRGTPWGPLSDPGVGLLMLLAGAGILGFGLMAWGHQIISEKILAHDPHQQQKDLQLFVLLFLCGELAAFGAVFAFFYHRHFQDPTFGPPHLPGFHFGGPLVAFATFLLLSSSVTCELAHHALEKGRLLTARLLFVATILLGVAFLGFQGFEWGELIQRGFTPKALGEGGAATFSAIFYTATGFHGLHVAIGLVMLFMVQLRLEVGHFRGKRTFSAVAASWYWHFVDIVWVLLFITVYVVG